MYNTYLFILFISVILVNGEIAIYNCPNKTKALNVTYDFENFIANKALNFSHLKLQCNTQDIIILQRNLFPINYKILKLSISGFQLHILSDAFRNFVNIKSIEIADCSIDLLNIGTFKELPTLKSISLQNNRLKIVNKNIFGKLKMLDLSKNQINYVSKGVYEDLVKNVDQINLSSNPLLCECINKWLIFGEYNSKKLIINHNFPNKSCDKANLVNCQTYFISKPRNISSNYSFMSFTDIQLTCPVEIKNSSNPYQLLWISPHSEIFSGEKSLFKLVLNNAKFIIQPLLIETKIQVNKTTDSLSIVMFRGYFDGNWTCRYVNNGGDYIEALVNINSIMKLRIMFLKLISIGLYIAGIVLLIAAIIGLVQYLKDTSCCTRKIDYSKSELFEKRFVNTVIPVPYEEDDDDSSQGSGTKDPMNEFREPLNEENIEHRYCRSRHESYNNNDVELIFRDEKLAEEYVQILEDLKQASVIGDENFTDRLSVLRNRFSIDFQKMRFELKRGMETLKSNSSAAAHKLKKSVGHQLKSFTEFCGTGYLTQSISIVVIPNNHGNNINKCNPPNVEDIQEEEPDCLSSPLSLPDQLPSSSSSVPKRGMLSRSWNNRQNTSSTDNYPRKVFRFFEFPTPIPDQRS